MVRERAAHVRVWLRLKMIGSHCACLLSVASQQAAAIHSSKAANLNKAESNEEEEEEEEEEIIASHRSKRRYVLPFSKKLRVA